MVNGPSFGGSQGNRNLKQLVIPHSSQEQRMNACVLASAEPLLHLQVQGPNTGNGAAHNQAGSSHISLRNQDKLP